ANPHRLPPHRHRGAKLSLLIITAQPLSGIEQPLVEMTVGVQPAQRRFGEIDGDAAALARNARSAARAFRGQLPFDEVALHGRISFTNRKEPLAKRGWL